MNIFKIRENKKPSLIGKLLKRTPKENALVEINNLFVENQNDLTKVSLEQIQEISEKYKLNHPNFIADSTTLSRQYNLEDFFHSFSDLSQIKFEKYNASKSIFSDLYIKQQRLIKNGVDYDKMK